MSADAHQVLRERLGAYVLGQLDPDSEARISHHVADCAACQAEVAELAPVVPLLAAVHPDELDEALRPPDTLPAAVRRRIVAERRRERMREYRSWALVAAAVAAVSVLAFSIGYAVRPPAAAPPPAPQPSPTASPNPSPTASPAPTRPSGKALTVQINDPAVTAKARVIGHRWGAELRLEGTGFQSGAVYLVRVYVQNGSWITAGSFVGAGSRKVRCALTTGVRRSDAVSFAVLGPGEATVLSGEM